MTIILTSRAGETPIPELNPIAAAGGRKTVQGKSRDVLSFVFGAGASLETLDAIFTEAACESITIIDDEGGEYVHKGYTIRAGLYKKAEEVSPATVDAGAVYEDRVTIELAQRTYEETQLAGMAAGLNALLTGEE